MNLSKLPAEVIIHILSYTDVPTITGTSQTNKALRAIILRQFFLTRFS